MMRSTTVDKLAELQKKPTQVRNICILAHVDHGKTTLADALVASNGIISQKMAGKLRYMDNREDEQTRGITMKSSAISLHYQNDTDKYLVNLIDSPGHVDFSSEVSTAVRLCDGAIVVVDVVEGVCPQTHAVLRQAWLENIKPILVLNKIDRLITELKMEPLEAFGHLQRILEHVNIVTSELFTADIMSMQTTNSSEENGSESQNCDWTEDADEMEHKNIYFTPDQGNVLFACAYDGWGFTVAQFAEIYSKKLGMNEEGLRKTLWGDFFLNSKTKRIMKGAQGKGKKPLFVQFVLDSIWSVYDVVMVRRDKDMMEKIIKSLSLKIAPRDLRHNDPRVQLQAIMSQWLPVSNIVLSAVVDKLPSPVEIMEEKVEKLMCNQARRFDSLPQQTQELKDAFLACKSTDDAPVIVFVSKMFPVEKSVLPKNKQRPLTDEELQRRRMEARQRHAARLEGAQNMTSDNDTQQDTASGTSMECMKEEKADAQTDDQEQVFIAFARVYSGTLRAGQKLYVLGPKHDPAMALEKLSEGSGVDSSMKLADLSPEDHMTVVTVTDLYLFMGRELESLDSVPAGNVLGIGGLEDHILKSGTLTSTVACPAFTDLYFDVSPILRVAVEPVNASDMPQLMKGLKLLNQADPCVQVLVQETGEHVIITAGEVHLRRCLEDLKKRYGKVSIMASSPIVPFRETIVPPPTVDMVNESIQEQNPQVRNEKLKEFEEDDEILEEGLVKIFTPSKHCMVQLRAVPLPPEVTDFLEENQVLIKTLDQYVSSKLSERRSAKYQDSSKLKHSTKESIKEFKEKLDNLFVKSGKCWSGCADSIWAFGPKRVGPNLLLNQVEGYNRTSLWEYVSREKKESVSYLRDYDYSVISGFQLATLTGPLCEEPMRGVCFIVEKWEIGINTLNSKGAECNSNGDASKTKDIKGMKTMEGESSDGIGISLTKLSLNNALDNTDIQVVDMLHSGKSYDCDTNKIDQSDNSTSISCENEQDQASCSYKFKSEITMENGKASNEVDNSDSDSDVDSVTSSKRSEVQGHVSGQLISIVKEGCRKGFQTQPQRLMAAMYKCTVQTTAEVLGKMYGVIGKRNGRILGEDMKEGSQMFSIDAVIPVVESLGFADDIRKKTSGLASPQLVFSHWEVIDVDPFWVPTTEEEIMHYGEKADSENRARVYMNSVRERKGLKVDKKIVEHAEKQRTLTKNK